MLRHTRATNAYPAFQYDDYMCLKPPLLLWLAVFYYSRAITLPIAMAIGHFAGVDDKAIELIRGFWSAERLIPSALAAVILYTLCRRTPNAPRAVRWIWARGRIFLSISAILDIALLLIPSIRRWEVNDQSLLSMASAAVDAYFLAYIFAARRVRQVFAEFPPPETDSQNSRNDH